MLGFSKGKDRFARKCSQLVRVLVPAALLRLRWRIHVSLFHPKVDMHGRKSGFDVSVTWLGRAGNSVLQIVNAIHFAKKTSSRVTLASSTLTDAGTFDFSSHSQELSPIRGCFLSMQSEGLANLGPSFSEQREIALQYLLPILNVPRKHLDEDLLVIHIRSGDIIPSSNEESVHTCYIQPPLSYFERVIHDCAAEKILIVTEPDRRNPVISVLCNRYGATVQSESVPEDFATLVAATKLCMGYSTFPHAAVMVSQTIRDIFAPEHNTLSEFSPCDPELLPFARLHLYKITHYIPPRKWIGSVSQLKRMIEHDPRYVSRIPHRPCKSPCRY